MYEETFNVDWKKFSLKVINITKKKINSAIKNGLMSGRVHGYKWAHFSSFIRVHL